MTRPTAPPSKRREGMVKCWAYVFLDWKGRERADAGTYRECQRAIKVRSSSGVRCGPITPIYLPRPAIARRKGK